MNRSKRRPPCVSILLLLLIGVGTMAIAFWLVDHRLSVPDSVLAIALLAGVFFVSFTWAFLRFLRWRDQNRAVTVAMPSKLSPKDVEGTVYGLISGREYQVMKSFTDNYGNAFQQGERLRFKQRHFLPYHGGHTILFDERALYLQEDQDSEILDHFSEYIALIQR